MTRLTRPWFRRHVRCEHPLITVRLDDLSTLMYGFDNREETALGSRPFARIRGAVKAAESELQKELSA